MKAALIFIICAALVVTAGVWLLSWDSPAYRRANPETDDAYAAGETRPLSAHVQGYVHSLPVNDNQPVRAGDLIAEIDPGTYQAQSEQATAQEPAAQANLDAIIARRHELELNVAQAAATRDAERAGLVQTAPNMRRQRALAATDVGLPRQEDAAVAAERANVAQIEGAQASLVAERRQLDVLAAQERQAKAELGARKAEATLAAITLGWTRITAPVDGVLGPRQVRVGSLLSTGAPVTTETPLDTVWVSANCTERQITDIRIGQPARLRVDAFPGQVLEGHVAGIAPATGAQFSQVVPDNTTGNYTKVVQRVPVKIAIDWNNSPLFGLVRPGMSVKVLITTDGGTPRQPRTIR
jgi:membrane fusion protein (multidrug efflux system)